MLTVVKVLLTPLPNVLTVPDATSTMRTCQKSEEDGEASSVSRMVRIHAERHLLFCITFSLLCVEESNSKRRQSKLRGKIAKREKSVEVTMLI
jgi:hypothetical protein